MSENKKIISDFKDKIKAIKKHNKHYYSKDHPIITDASMSDQETIENLRHPILDLLSLLENTCRKIRCKSQHRWLSPS